MLSKLSLDLYLLGPFGLNYQTLCFCTEYHTLCHNHSNCYNTNVSTLQIVETVWRLHNETGKFRVLVWPSTTPKILMLSLDLYFVTVNMKICTECQTFCPLNVNNMFLNVIVYIMSCFYIYLYWKLFWDFCLFLCSLQKEGGGIHSPLCLYVCPSVLPSVLPFILPSVRLS